MAFTSINTDAIENEIGGLMGPLGAPMSPLCDSLKRQRTISDISTGPNSPVFSNMSPTSTMASMSPRMGNMSPMMGISSPMMGSALPEVAEHQPSETQFIPFSVLSEEPKNVFYVPDDENPLELSFVKALSCFAKEEETEEEMKELEEKVMHETNYVEKDGATWIVTRGCPQTMSQLEDDLAMVKALYKTKYGEDVDAEEEAEEDQADEHENNYVEKDGVKWIVTRGRPKTTSELEDMLFEVKSLYKTKYGEDADDEDEEEEQTDEHEAKDVDKDGVTCSVTRGCPKTASQLEDMLAEVKSLYKTKYGKNVDDEEEEEDEEEEQTDEHDTKHVEKDGITWIVTRGRPKSTSELEDMLTEVKSLYETKYGEYVDDEEEEEEEQADEHDTTYVEKDGITWTVTRGRPPTMSQLEDELAEVKSLYETKYGDDVDNEEEEEEEQADEHDTKYGSRDALTWSVSRGRPPTMSQLEDMLTEVKSLYKTKYGEDVDEEEEQADEHDTKYVEKDGITWTVTRGRPPTMSQLEDLLAEVKSLYKTKYGEDVDDEEEEEEEQADENDTTYVEKDGLTWTVTRGRPPTMSQLEEKLAEVKSLYKTKYGDDVDEEEEEQADEHDTKYVSKDALKWSVTRGRPKTTSQLEDMLIEVKSLYKTKYGEDVNDEEEEEADEQDTEYVEKDGITWTVTRGRPPTMSQLEDKLAAVKSLYKTKYGEDVDDEEGEEEEQADEHDTKCVEKDALTWIVTRGRPKSTSELEDMLTEVKSLYKSKYGEDVDQHDTKYMEKDGITWTVTRGCPPTMSQLEDKLAEVKSLYKTKYGQDVDDDEEEKEEQTDEHDTTYVEKDGITWNVTRGRPKTTSQLEEMLTEVKSLYKTKYEEDVDDEEEEEDRLSSFEGSNECTA